MSTISVQIVTYNSERDIVPCLNAILHQNYQIEHIIVVDNNSVDRTVELVSHFKNIEIVKNQQNIGFAGGHNQALHYSNSEYVLVLNPDTILDCDYIRNILNVMEKSPLVGMASGKLYRDMNEKVLDSTGIIIKKNRRAFDRGAGEKDIGQYDDNADVFGVSGAAAIYRRSMIEDVSLNRQFFDEAFFAYKEDVDVSWRAQLLGWSGIFVSNAIAQHSRGWQGKRKRTDVSFKIRCHSYINRYFCILKNDYLSYFLLHLPIILFYELLGFCYLILKERDLLKSWGMFFHEYKQMIQKRRYIQMKRKSSHKHLNSYFKGIW